MAEALTKREAAKRAIAWEPQVGDTVRVPGGAGIGKDLYGWVDRLSDYPGYVHLRLEDTDRNPPGWRGKTWPGRQGAVEFLLRPDPATLAAPDGGGNVDSDHVGAASVEAAPAASGNPTPESSPAPVLVAGFRNGEAWLVEEHKPGEWLVLFRERGKEDRLDPKNPLPFPTAEKAARAIGRRCRDDHEAKDRDVWRNGPLGLAGWLAYGEAVQQREVGALRTTSARVAPAVPMPDNSGEGPGRPNPDAAAGTPVLLEEPEQPAAGHHVGAMMTGNTSLGEGAQLLAYFTETTENGLHKKSPRYGEDHFGGFLYLARDDGGYRLGRYGGVGEAPDRALDGVLYGERGDALAAARDWLRCEDPRRKVGFIYHFACGNVLPRFTTYTEYMTEILRQAGFNYRLIETADGRIHTQDYGCTVTPDGSGVFVRRAENGEEADRVRFEDIVRIWNGHGRTAEGLCQEGIVVWRRDDIPDFQKPVFCEAADKEGVTTWRGKDGYLAFRAIPNEKMGYVLERCNTSPNLSAFVGYAKDLVEARARLGIPPRPLGYGDDVEADPKVVARASHGETTRCWAVEPDVDGEIRVLSGPPGKKGRWMYLRTVATEDAAIAYLGERFSKEAGFHWAWESPTTRPPVARRSFTVDPERLAEGAFQYTAGHKNGVLVGEGDIHAARSAHRVSDPGAYKVPSIAPPFTHEGRLWMTAGCDEQKAVAYELVPQDLWDGPTLAYADLPRDEAGQLTQGYHGLLVRHGKDRYVCLGDAADFLACVPETEGPDASGSDTTDFALTPPPSVVPRRRRPVLS